MAGGMSYNARSVFSPTNWMHRGYSSEGGDNFDSLLSRLGNVKDATTFEGQADVDLESLLSGRSRENFNLLSPKVIERLERSDMTDEQMIIWKRKMIERASELKGRRACAQLTYGVEEPSWEQIRDVYESGDYEREVRYMFPSLPEEKNTQNLLRREERFKRDGRDIRFSEEHPHRPLHPSFFTGMSPYFQKLDDITNVIEETAEMCRSAGIPKTLKDVTEPLPTEAIPYSHVHGLHWIKKPEMESMINFALKNSEFKSIQKLLSALASMPFSQFQGDFLKKHTLPANKRPKDKAKGEVINGEVHQFGGRKTAKASVRMTLGTGNYVVNGKPMTEYFDLTSCSESALSPLIMTGLVGEVDCRIEVRKGGLTGQAEAIRHGVAKCLLVFCPDSRPMLKKAGFITRDHRVVERKKPGQKKARKKFTWVKR